MGHCKSCEKNIGRIQSLRLRVARRVIKKAEKKFKLNLGSALYAGLCSKCFLKAGEKRFEVLKVEIHKDMEKSGKTPEQLVSEVKKWIEKKTLKGLRRVKI